MKLHISIIVASMLFAAMAAVQASEEISSKPTENMSCTGGICTPTAKKAVLNVDDLAAMLASGDTTIKSTNTNPDIEIDAALRWTSTSRLTLDSYHSIAFNKPVVVAGTGAMTITTNDGGSGGDFRFFKKGHVEFWDLKSDLTINGRGYVLVNKLKQLALDIRHNNIGYYALAKNINTKKRTYAGAPIDHSFEGTFEGLGNIVSNLTIQSASGIQAGLFSDLVTVFAVIRDVGLTSVKISGSDADIGALVGANNDGTIMNSYATGEVSGAGQSHVGGLVGFTNSTVMNSYADVAVSNSGSGGAAGGLVGYLRGDCLRGCDGVIDNSFAVGLVMAGDDSSAGGLVGYSFGGIITNSYAVGAVSVGNSGSVGGMIGINTDNTDVHTGPVVLFSYATGLVTGGSGATVGGLIGQDVPDSQNTNSYWDMDTSGISDPSQGAGNIANDPGITGLTDAQFKSGLPAGFDKKVWKQKGSVNYGYPYLADNPPPQ